MTRKKWAKMTATKKTAYVAKLCGFVRVDRDACYGEKDDGEILFVPHYLHDLNAMHEAVAQMTEVQFCQYVKILCGYQGHKGRLPWSGGDAGRAEKATAAERAEAFVLAMHECRNDWKESK